MRGYEEEQKDGRTAFQRYRLPIAVGILLLLAIGFVASKLAAGGSSAAQRPASMVVVSLPPPPPPPAPIPPPLEQPKIVEQEQAFVPEDKPIDQPPPDEPPIGTNIKGDGSNDNFGLGNKAGNGRFSSNGGSRYGAYASQVQTSIAEALRNNRKTRDASLSVKVRIWPDVSGRIERAQLAGSSGNPALDAAIENDVLNGLQLREPPPAGMPTPILLRLTARRPN